MAPAPGHLSPPVPGATPLMDSAALRAADAWASQARGVPSVLLMERAGHEAFRCITARYPAARRVTVLVGPGNNGGDGLVVARLLREAGHEVRAVSRDGVGPGTPDGAAMTQAAGAFGVRVEPFTAEGLPACDVVVDALLGTGQDGELRDPIRSLCRAANAQAAPIVALDVPTGVAADTGEADADAVRADLTVTFHADTVGLRVAPGRSHAGAVVVVPIGVPEGVPEAAAAWAFDAGAVRGVPRKGAEADKYAAGAVLVVAGCDGMAGAARLAGLAALRAGAGLVLAAVPRGVAPAVAGGTPELMVRALPGDAPHLVAGDVGDILDQAGRFAALALGPGLGRDPGTGVAVRDLLARCALPAVVDADALWHLVGHLDVVAARGVPTVLTPHTGEAARLLGTPRPDVDAGRLRALGELVAQTQATVVLKGPGTLVGHPEGAPLVCRDGGPELATAGSGDVLTGTIAAFLAAGAPARQAAAAGVGVHAAAGRRARRGDGTIAGDVADALPAAVAGGRQDA